MTMLTVYRYKSFGEWIEQTVVFTDVIGDAVSPVAVAHALLTSALRH